MVNVQSRYFGQGLWFVSAPITVQAAQTIAAWVRDRSQADQIEIQPSSSTRIVDLRA